MNSSRIRSVRREKEISGTEIADKLGISAQYYYDIEKGKRNLSADIVAKLAEIFDVSVDYLLGISDVRKIGHQMIMDYEKDTYREMTDEEEHLGKIELEQRLVEKILDQNIVEADEDSYEGRVVIREFSKIKENYPDIGTSRDKKDLRKFLEQSEIMFDGVPMTDEDKSRIQGYMEAMFWDAKQKNKRKKKDEE